ncbi:MAG: tandem-95 repeat protein [Gammaproteobacteria bacterium]
MPSSGYCRVFCASAIRSFLTLLFLASFILDTTPAHAEGSVSLNPSGAAGIRHYLPDSPGFAPANIPSTSTFFAYANVGDTINLGSSANGVNNGRINYRPPTPANGAFTVCPFTNPPVSGSTGFIIDRGHELAGPLPNAGGYTPCTVTVGAGQSGLWEITFTAPTTGNNGGTINEAANANWAPQGNGDVTSKAWDITVRNSGGTAIPGRVFTNVLGATNSGGNLQSQTFIQTVDGYRYRWRLNGTTPGTAALLSNAEGFTQDGVRLFRSIQLAGTLNPGVLPAPPPDIRIGILPANPTPTDYLAGLHKIFLNPPATDLPASTTSPRGNTWLLVPPVVFGKVTAATFSGVEGTPNQTGAGILSGLFRVTIDGPGTILVQIDLNNNGVFTDAIDRALSRTVAAAGAYDVPWDGNNGLGVPVAPTDGPAQVSIASRAAITGGEVHFPALDFEANVNGYIIERLDTTTNNPQPNGDIVFFDDRVIQTNNPGGNGTTSTTCGADADNGVNPLEAVAGIASAAGAHKWTGGSLGYGNCRGMDTWSLLTTPALAIALSIRIPQANLEIVSKTHAPATLVVGGPVTYTIVARNNGVSDTTATVHDVFPPEITGLSVVSCTPTPGATCGASSFTGNTFLGNVTLNVNAPATPTSSVTYVISGTVSALPAGGNLVNVAGIQRPADVFDPTATNPNATPPVQTLQGVRDECNFTVAGSGDGNAPTCNNLKGDTATVINPQADMTATGNTLPTTVTAGQTVTGQITCTNNGPDPARATCGISGLPAGATVTCTSSPATLASGSAMVCDVAYVAPASGTVNATVTAGSNTADPTPANNTASYTATVTGQADMQAAASGFPSNPPAGSSVTGTVLCTNNGPSAAATPSCAITGLPTGATVTCTPNPVPNPLAVSQSIRCAVNFIAPPTGTITVLGTAGSTTADPTPANNNASTQITVVPQADVQATTTAPAGVSAGQNVVVSGVCANVGPSPAAAPSCALSGLPSGTSQTCAPNPAPNPLAVGQSITCTASFIAPASGTLTITTTAATTTADPVPANNTDAQTVAIDPKADMAAVVTGFPLNPLAGVTATGTVTCVNNGPSAATAPTCAVSGTPLGATINCTPNPAPDPLAVGQAINCAVSFVVPPSGAVTITGTAGTSTVDPNRANDSASVGVTSTSIPPEANNDVAATPYLTPVTLAALANDNGNGGATLDSTSVDLDPATPGQQTSLTIPAGSFSAAPDGRVTFTPAPGFTGTISVPYTVEDNLGQVSNTANLIITVNPPAVPAANPDSATGIFNTPVTLPVLPNDVASGSTTLNPAAVDLDPATPGIQTTLTLPGQGTFAVNPAGVVTFTPVAGFIGTASTPYTVQDNLGQSSNPATLTVVIPPPRNPLANDDTASTPFNTPATVAIINNDQASGSATIDPATIDLDPATPGMQASVTVPGQGQFITSPSGVVTFIPAPGFVGVASVPYGVNDSLGQSSNPATFTVTVNPPLPVTAANDAASTPFNTPVTIAALVNDSAALGASLDPTTLDLDPATAGVQTNFTVPNQGTFSVGPSGLVTFTPVAGFTGTATIPYQVQDNYGQPSNSATLTVTVAAPAAPLATDDSASTPLDTPVTLNPAANDAANGGATLVLGSINLDPATTRQQTTLTTPQGTWTLNPATGQVTFTPAAGFTGVATIPYTIQDSLGQTSNVASLTVTVIAGNAPPVAYPVTAPSMPNSNGATPILALSGSDPDGAVVSFAITALPPASQGVLLLCLPGAKADVCTPVAANQVLPSNQVGSLQFDPAPGFVGAATFSYTATDNAGATSSPAVYTVPVRRNGGGADLQILVTPPENPLPERRWSSRSRPAASVPRRRRTWRSSRNCRPA